MNYLQSISANANLRIDPKIPIIQMQKGGLESGNWVVAHNHQGFFHYLPNP
ncbi:hypothetical protein [Nostoc sp.]|uniref:hypothetical protein n=1 Tax=Nostoc sp. TaxID=1180 RepID=UPI002FF92E1D